MTRRRVRWAVAARRDLEALVAYLAERNPTAALATLDRIEGRARSLTTQAHRGRLVPELARLHLQHYRELIVPPHRIIYRIAEGTVLVLAVFDSRRNLEDVLLDRLIRIDGP